MQNTRELPLEQNLNLHQVGDPIKRHTDLFKYGYLACVELAIFVGKDSVSQKFSFETLHMIDDVVTVVQR